MPFLKVEFELEEFLKAEKLLSTICHDFRNPISALISYAHLFDTQLEDASNEQIRTWAEGIQRTNHRLQYFLQVLSILNPIKKNAYRPELKTLSLEDLLAKAIDPVVKFATLRKIEVQVLKLEKDLNILSDPTLLELWIYSCLRTLVDETPKGGKIVVSARRTLDQPSQIELILRNLDSSSEHLQKIEAIRSKFRPKEQASSNLQDLGLCICTYLQTTLLDSTLAIESNVDPAGILLRIQLKGV